MKTGSLPFASHEYVLLIVAINATINLFTILKFCILYSILVFFAPQKNNNNYRCFTLPYTCAYSKILFLCVFDFLVTFMILMTTMSELAAPSLVHRLEPRMEAIITRKFVNQNSNSFQYRHSKQQDSTMSAYMHHMHSLLVCRRRLFPELMSKKETIHAALLFYFYR